MVLEPVIPMSEPFKNKYTTTTQEAVKTHLLVFNSFMPGDRV